MACKMTTKLSKFPPLPKIRRFEGPQPCASLDQKLIAACRLLNIKGPGGGERRVARKDRGRKQQVVAGSPALLRHPCVDPATRPSRLVRARAAPAHLPYVPVAQRLQPRPTSVCTPCGGHSATRFCYMLSEKFLGGNTCDCTSTVTLI